MKIIAVKVFQLKQLLSSTCLRFERKIFCYIYIYIYIYFSQASILVVFHNDHINLTQMKTNSNFFV